MIFWRVKVEGRRDFRGWRRHRSYRAECTCGWRGRWVGKKKLAAVEVEEHHNEHQIKARESEMHDGH